MKLIIEKQLKVFSLVFLSTLILGVYGSQIPVYGQDFNPEKSNLTVVPEQFSNLLNELGINASELTLKPGENVTVLIQKIGPNGTLSEFAQKFTESVEKSGVDVDNSLKQVENLTQSAKELANLP
ncbi:MAG: hypothetical protein ACXWFB_04995 [Nitrososphaeraceae archaeon]